MNSNSWLIKYNPTNLKEFVGNEQNIKLIQEWLLDFQSGDCSSILYICGNTGIGKTSLIYLLLKQYGYHIYEMNSGDVRSRKRMEEIADKILNHKTINIKRKIKKAFTNPVALIMDEIDGMSCGDKGGLHYLFEMMEKNVGNISSPIICISTKPYDKRVNDKVLEIQMDIPSLQQIKSHCLNIICKERMFVEDLVIDDLINFCKSDIRKIVIMLQELCDFFPDTLITIDHFECITSSILEEKEYDVDLFNITDMIFNEKLNDEKIQYYYETEMNLIPLMIYENIPSQFEKRKIDNIESIELYHNILNHYCLTDLIDNNMLKYGELNYNNCVMKCELVNYLFSLYEPKNTKKKEKIKFTGSLSKSALMSNNITFYNSFSNNNNISQYYLPIIFDVIINILTNKINVLTIKNDLIIYSSDLEKILQFYQKWFIVNNNTLLKLKKLIKGFELKDY